MTLNVFSLLSLLYVTFSHLAFERRFHAFSGILVRIVTLLTFGTVPLFA